MIARRRSTALVAAAIGGGVFASFAQGAITVDTSVQTSTLTGANSGFISFTNSANAANTTVNGGASAPGTPTNNIQYFATAQGPSSASIAQSFEALTTGTLTNIEFLLTGTPATTFTVAIYDAGSAGTTTANAPGGTPGNQSRIADTGYSKYSVDTATNTPGVPGTPDTNGNTYVTPNLLVSGDGVNVSSGGYSAVGNNGVDADIDFTGVDSIPLLAGEEYVVELSSITGSPFFERNPGTAGNGAATDYPYGQAYIGGAVLNGNAQRDFAVGVTVAVPEPASLGLIGVVGAGLLARRRKM